MFTLYYIGPRIFLVIWHDSLEVTDKLIYSRRRRHIPCRIRAGLSLWGPDAMRQRGPHL